MSNRLLQIKNVVGYGDGLKRVSGKKTNQESLIFFVEKKTNEISDADRIPKEINGKPTDVIETGKFSPRLLTPCSIGLMSQEIVPLRGALAIATGEHLGTLGAIVKDPTTGRLLAMTNSHVAGNPINCNGYEAAQLEADGYTNFTQAATSVGTLMYQPVTTGNQFGEVYRDKSRNFTLNRVDCALITIKSEFGVTPGIMGLTKYAQPFIHPGTIPVGTEVIKSGKTSGVTYGEVTSMNATVTVHLYDGSPGMVYENQIIITSDDTSQAFLDYGDSGSALCVDLGNGKAGLIGQLHSGTDADASGSTSVASRLDDIVDLLDIVPWRGEIITGNDHEYIVSTGFGAVYEEDSTTFLARTNDYVCEGTVCGLGDLVVYSSGHSLKSYQHYDGVSDIILGYRYLITSIDLDVGVPVKVELESFGGAVIDSVIKVKPELEATIINTAPIEVDLNVKILASPDIQIDNNFGAQLDVESTVWLKVEGGFTILQGINADVDADIRVRAYLSADIINVAGAIFTVDNDVEVSVVSDIELTGSEADYSNGGGGVSTCSNTDYDPLAFEGCV